ncbi:hypothetical protein Cst_c13890 [Thermoclostridium stercorarium subsp. stercorarium DSM 8532]|uniref:Uncharacterized protein n=1 Tax=Thermoclostridium stercorarium (strain ATCC 35414 / DSM 8532 / NCIMB 11754) TaxID=1121335 RepID=L7VJT4_THES1|nr:hypothetical protein Cst_c13890 [Thermoclostridium stercorarium subsp. stercorarium DSM 8532]
MFIYGRLKKIIHKPKKYYLFTKRNKKGKHIATPAFTPCFIPQLL